MRIVYMGTPDFAVPALEKIVSMGWDVPLVITKEDQPAGRGHQLKACEVKQKAQELGLAVETPHKLKNNEEIRGQLRAIAPDFIVVAAYGKILPKDILEIPRYGCVNIHGSLLPRWRGAAPIQRAVLAGDKTGGVSIMFMAEELDAGDVLVQKEISFENKTSEQVFEELSVLGADLLCECLPKIVSGKLKGAAQDNSKATYASMIRKEEAQIDWNRPAEELKAHVLGMYSWPIAFTAWDGKMMKVHEADVSPARTQAPAGTVVSAGKEGIGVACGDGGVLLLKKIQLPGKKAMDAGAFLLGNRIETGTVLG